MGRAFEPSGSFWEIPSFKWTKKDIPKADFGPYSLMGPLVYYFLLKSYLIGDNDRVRNTL